MLFQHKINKYINKHIFNLSSLCVCFRYGISDNIYYTIKYILYMWLHVNEKRKKYIHYEYFLKGNHKYNNINLIIFIILTL